MAHLIVTPPVVFILFFFVALLLSRVFSRLAFHPRKNVGGSGESYACGEENYNYLAQPDYTTFFPFAFFFTLAHVATLIVTTLPAENVKSFAMALLYILGAVAGLVNLLKK